MSGDLARGGRETEIAHGLECSLSAEALRTACWEHTRGAAAVVSCKKWITVVNRAKRGFDSSSGSKPHRGMSRLLPDSCVRPSPLANTKYDRDPFLAALLE